MAAILSVPDHDPAPLASTETQAVTVPGGPPLAPDRTQWRLGLPFRKGERLALRDLQASDAPSLLALLAPQEVSRFLSPPPATLEGFERFIAWAARTRERGTYVCFAVVPTGSRHAVGFFQLRALDDAFGTAEWGFALGRPFWGTGLFPEGAAMTLDFAFGIMGIRRLEARSVVGNGRGNGALRKIGAVREAILRESFARDGQVHDQALWSILDVDWAHARARAAQPALVVPGLLH